MKTPQFTKPKDKSPAGWAIDAANRCYALETRAALHPAAKAALKAARAEYDCAVRLMDLLEEGNKPRRCDQVTEALRLLGEPEVILVKGRESAYLYFAEGDAMTWPSSSVYTSRLSDQTVEEWVRDFERLSGRALLSAT